ncbi:hypothetical protein [Streptomyces sp. NBC_00385]|uniref:hypothetical protein n=1 Tax=Streptomyces sp. NBC_00385 TaxID=2975733 RepID=UPI002DD9CBCE|nr:hypothetical protein [Streptomyces sp. NBC_00385]WRZ05987.1 hypothetical protein OG959_22910 [Streptomyces sp. NBC_00385]
MNWTYSERWNKLTERPMTPMTERKARSRHSTGQLYTAVPASDTQGSPALRVEIRWETEYAGVIFMDHYGRDELRYSFSVINGRLFLDGVRRYEYGNSLVRGGYANATYMESYDFTPDGVAHRTVESGADSSRESREMDVTLNWERIPEFGEYDSLMRRDREHP